MILPINMFTSYTQQSAYVFNRSIRYNIDFNYSDDNKKLNNVIELVELNDFISKLPNGVDTQIDEEIDQISGGEKLRIHLARALYRDSDIILLDEVTSSLEKSMSDRIEKKLIQMHNKTIINVCHKFNEKNLYLYDDILVVEKGELVLRGTYDEIKKHPLLERYRHEGVDSK